MKTLLNGPYPVLPDCHVWIAATSAFPLGTIASEKPDESPHLLLNSTDHQRWAKYRCLKKREQFLQSRWAVKAVLERELGKEFPRFVFGTDPSGRPFVRTTEGTEEKWISISHSDSLTAVAYSWGSWPVGIDIETIRPLNAPALRDVFVTEKEKIWLRENGWLDNEEAIRILWTMKEAAWKASAGRNAVPLAEISVVLQNGELLTKLANPNSVPRAFRTRVIGSAFSLAWPDAMVIQPPDEISAFQGSFSLCNADSQRGTGCLIGH